jgi:hypothetical protein
MSSGYSVDLKCVNVRNLCDPYCQLYLLRNVNWITTTCNIIYFQTRNTSIYIIQTSSVKMNQQL